MERVLLFPVEKRLQKVDGFTYVETLIVILIMVIIITIIHYHPFDSEQADIAEVNDELLAVINYYQTLAVKTGKTITLIFPPGQSEIKILSKALQIDAVYQMRNGAIYSGNNPRGVTISFVGETIDHGATIHYFIQNKRFSLIFQLVRGRVRIEAA